MIRQPGSDRRQPKEMAVTLGVDGLRRPTQLSVGFHEKLKKEIFHDENA